MVRFATSHPAVYPLFVRERAGRYGAETLAGPFRPAVDGADPADPSDPDALESLGEEIATLAAHIHAADHRLLTLLCDFDRRRGWELDGQRSCAHWLAYRTGIELGAAREKVRAARALSELPLISASMSRGELSFSKVRALTRVADASNESDLLELARGCTTAQLERVVRAWRKGSRKDEAERARELRERRSFSIVPDEDGGYRVRGRLEPEVGALLMRAVEAAGDALFRERGWPEGVEGGSEASAREAARRRADALALLAERAMAAGFGAEDEVPVSGTKAQRYQVVLHVDAQTLEAEGEPGRSELEDGTRVSAETSRRAACDAGLVRIEHAPDGSVLDVGRKTRTVSSALRRALEARDRGCRFPGCGSRFCDAHHVRHWVDGGETSLSNCVLLCSHHHALLHEGGWTMGWWGEGRPVFWDPRGGTHFEGRWQPPAREGDAAEENATQPEAGREGMREGMVEALLAEHRARGVHPDWRTPSARWKSLELIPDAVYFRATRALG